MLGRVINLAMPLALGKLVSILEGHSSQSPWPFLLGYIALRFLQGNGGLSALRDVSVSSLNMYHINKFIL
jgi:hypothetical protein